MSNVINFEPYYLAKRYTDEELEFQAFLDMFTIEQEIAANDNFSESFESLLDLFIPETVEDYEKFFGNTFEDDTLEVWFNPETGEFEDSSSY